MNTYERKMLDILNKLRSEHGAVGVKAEFEAEGTRVDELLRLLDISRRSGLNVGLKIGGCEAVRDLIEAKQFGVDYIIAPMVESTYALQKFIDAKNKVFQKDEIRDVSFLVNIETALSAGSVAEMTKIAAQDCGIQGFVYGRVDYVGSLGMSREDVETVQVTNTGIEIAKNCSASKLDLVVGGAISINSVQSLRAIKNICLTRFETRKIIFQAQAVDMLRIDEALLEAVHFELLWLLNKRDYYKVITNEDEKRIEMLDARWKILGKN